MASPKLLVADDSYTIQKVIKLALANDGYEIHCVSDGKDALERITLLKPAIVLVDVNLPSLSAFELKRRVGAMDDLRHVKFILMASSHETFDEAQYQEVGYNGKLAKPFDPPALRELLTQTLGSAPSPGSRVPTPPPFKKAPHAPTRMPPPLDLGDEDTGHHDLPPLPGYQPPKFEPPTFDLDDLRISDKHEEFGTETDIRRLTEETVKHTNLAGLGGTLPPDEPASDFDSEWSIQEPKLRPPHAMRQSSDVTLKEDPPSVPHPPFPRPDPIDLPADTQSLELEEPTMQVEMPIRGGSGMSSDQIERLVQSQVEKQVAKHLERLAKELLPQMAERVIKQEIHKLLESSP